MADVITMYTVANVIASTVADVIAIYVWLMLNTQTLYVLFFYQGADVIANYSMWWMVKPHD